MTQLVCRTVSRKKHSASKLYIEKKNTRRSRSAKDSRQWILCRFLNNVKHSTCVATDCLKIEDNGFFYALKIIGIRGVCRYWSCECAIRWICQCCTFCILMDSSSFLGQCWADQAYKQPPKFCLHLITVLHRCYIMIITIISIISSSIYCICFEYVNFVILLVSSIRFILGFFHILSTFFGMANMIAHVPSTRTQSALFGACMMRYVFPCSLAYLPRCCWQCRKWRKQKKMLRRNMFGWGCVHDLILAYWRVFNIFKGLKMTCTTNYWLYIFK